MVTKKSKRFGLLSILFFDDKSFIVSFGAGHKPPIISIGWYRWAPNFVDFPRWWASSGVDRGSK